MAFKKKKKDDFDGLPVSESNRIIYKKEELDALKIQLKRGGYIRESDEILTLEKELDYLCDQGIIKLIKRKPKGMGKIVNDFEITIRHDMAYRFDQESDKLRQLCNRKGYISKVKNDSLLYPVTLVKKYAPQAFKEKELEQEKIKLKVPETPPIQPKKPLLPIEPTIIDPNDIKL